MSKIGASPVVHIMRNAFRLIDPRLMEHGERTAYILYKMLKYADTYQESELQKIIFIAILRDIGAYKTDKIDSLLTLDYKNVWQHSVYGYLYFKYLSPFPDYAQIILYHHLDSHKAAGTNFKFADVAVYVNLADKLDLILCSEQDVSKSVGLLAKEPYSPEALKLFYAANQEFGIIKSLTDGSYKEELYSFMNNLDWDKTACDMLLYMLVYAIDFRAENTVVRTISTHAMARYLGRSLLLAPDEQEDLSYASLIYDLGMLAVPDSIVNAPRRLTIDERKIMQNHVRLVDTLLKPYVSEEIHALAVRHHEKLDGSGYLAGITDLEFTIAQRILMVADLIAALQTSKQYKEALSRDEVLHVLNKELRERKLCPIVVKAAIRGYDGMMAFVEKERQTALKDYYDINNQFGIIIKDFEKIGS